MQAWIRWIGRLCLTATFRVRTPPTRQTRSGVQHALDCERYSIMIHDTCMIRDSHGASNRLSIGPKNLSLESHILYIACQTRMLLPVLYKSIEAFELSFLTTTHIV